MYKHSPCALFITGDIKFIIVTWSKGNVVTTPSGNVSYRLLRWLWANDITTAWDGAPNGTLSMMFIWCPNLMFLASPWLEIYIDFQTSHFADFEQFKVDIYFANFGQVKIHPLRSFLLTLDRSQLFYQVWVRHAAKNN